MYVPTTTGLRIEATLRARGSSYNGHPVSFGYFGEIHAVRLQETSGDSSLRVCNHAGSYAMDGLAVALFCVASTSSLNAALERCINFRGDADSTGAIVGQLAGAIYGIGALHWAFVENLQQWDDGEVAVRAYMLHFWGQQHTAGLRPSAENESNEVAEQQAATAAVAGKHLWRRHYVGDREFWRRTGVNLATGQLYTREEKDASICFALPDTVADVVMSIGQNEAVSDANRAWFDMHWTHGERKNELRRLTHEHKDRESPGATGATGARSLAGGGGGGSAGSSGLDGTASTLPEGVPFTRTAKRIVDMQKEICHQLGVDPTLTPAQVCQIAREELGMPSPSTSLPIVQNCADILACLGLPTTAY